MIAFICLFFPAVITVWLYETAAGVDLGLKKWLYRYCASNLLVNLVCFGVKRYTLDSAGAPFYTLAVDVTPVAALHYLIMAIPSAAVLAFVQALLTKHGKVTLEDGNHD